MNGIGERISQIIEMNHIKQVEFAKRIGVDPSYVSHLTSGKRLPSDRTISDICREFGVSEVWLRTGEGKMYLPKSRNEQLISFFSEILEKDDDDFIRSFCTALAGLDKERLHQLAEISQAMMEHWKNQENKGKKEADL